MEKRNVIAHIFAAIVFFIFSIILFKMGNGSIVVAQYFQHNGDPEAKKGLATLIVMYGLILSAVSGLNFALSDDDQRFVSWIIATIIIAVAFFVFSLFSLHVVIVYIIGGIVTIWWIIVAIKEILSVYYNYDSWAVWAIAICRVILVITLLSFIVVWYFNQSYSSNPAEQFNNFITTCNIAGVLAILSSISFVGESIIWLRYLDY